MSQEISEFKVELSIQDLINGSASSARHLLRLDSLASEERIVSAIDECIYRMQKGDGPILDKKELANYLFGSLWGKQLETKLGWEWAEICFHEFEDARAVGIFSPDRSLAIYPFHFIESCLDEGLPVTILLAFNMLVDGTGIPKLPHGGYENVMEHVHHIVPRD
jgi:hypothetical protein